MLQVIKTQHFHFCTLDARDSYSAVIMGVIQYKYHEIAIEYNQNIATSCYRLKHDS